MLDKQAKHLNGVPPKPQIVHLIYSSRSTFLRMRRPGNIQSPRTENGTSQPQHNMPRDICWGSHASETYKSNKYYDLLISIIQIYIRPNVCYTIYNYNIGFY